MTAREFCASGNQELVKCGVHGAAGAIVAVMAAYNIAACCFRRDQHLRVNAVLYTLAFAWEVKQTFHHLIACERTGGSEVVPERAA